MFIEGGLFIPDSAGIAAGPHPGYLGYLRIVILQNLRKNIGRTRYPWITWIASFFQDNAAETVTVGMEGIVVELVVGPEENKNKAGHAHSEAGDIDEKIPFIPPDISEGGLDVVFKHIESIYRSSQSIALLSIFSWQISCQILDMGNISKPERKVLNLCSILLRECPPSDRIAAEIDI